ncbi:transglycosylase domain-containing protein [Sphingomonas sp. LB-2]|uniref:transglycosylase domain-containing protein n=1 Tax=Sphingomonas caeni TaxID=2984949 RepID=UPI002232A93E|nr:transglycosylase domain-containing protein [Sphingomonas caeni]MCW3846367.1 transglycosylase domain-containing protein [Sphingomonas caeni]
MANDDDFERRFPLRRPPPEAEPAPRPAASQGWTAKSQSRIKDLLDTLELSGGLPPPNARTEAPRQRAASPPPPPPPLELAEPVAAGPYTSNLPVLYRPSLWKWVGRGLGAFTFLFILAVGWLALTAPLSKSLQPPAPPSIELRSAEGTPIARRGAVIGEPIKPDELRKLPDYVRNAFVAIEDRRFYSHWGVDPRGITRALVNNVSGGGRSQGGSTITQQLAKNAFLNADRTATRKFQEVLIAFWLEAWLTKDDILSRYLSYVYFGDNVYGLRAAAQHYFSCTPDKLTISQATMLAGLVQAPSRLAPTGNLRGAQARQKLVIAAMVDSGLLGKAEASEIRLATLKLDRVKQLPNGGYFADWVLPQARDRAGEIATQQVVETTLEIKAQRAAERAVRNAGLRRSQIALVAMHPDGRVVAMVGGTNYAASPFNRATQARRQPGSTFKLFVYLAALRDGMTPDTIVQDTPVSFGGWSPENHNGKYSGPITLRQAFAKSSNVVAARLTRELGVAAVTREARNLGISTPIGNDAAIALGTSTGSLLEITAAYASIAAGTYPVRPRGLFDTDDQGWFGAPSKFDRRTLTAMQSMLQSVVESGTGTGARLSIDVFGKTGTTQDNRDALFIGYAGDLVVGVWVGNDDNSPSPGLAGSGLPVRVWRDFMTSALNVPVAREPAPVENLIDDNGSVGLDDVPELISKALGDGKVETEVETDGPPDAPSPDAPRRREDATVPQGPRIETRVERPPSRPKTNEGN